MNRHLLNLSNAFYTLAAVAGIPALGGTLFFGYNVFRLQLLTPKPPAAAPHKSPEGVVDVVQDTVNAVGGILGLLGGIADAVLIGLAAASVCILAFAIVMAFTGKGLRMRRTWARWVAFLLTGWLGFVSLFAAASAGFGPIAMIALAVLAGSGYSIWVLLKCYGAETPALPPPAYAQPYPPNGPA